MSGPLTQILAAFQAGATSLAEVAARTGLADDLVRAGVDHLVRTGRLEAKELAQGCPGGGCGSCASGTPTGTAGCGAAGPNPHRGGPVLVALSVRRPGD